MFHLGQLVIHKRTGRRSIFMGLNQETGEAYLLFKVPQRKRKPTPEPKVSEMVIDINLVDNYEEVIEGGKINPGSFSIKTFLIGKYHGFLRLKDSDEKTREKITQLALQDL